MDLATRRTTIWSARTQSQPQCTLSGRKKFKRGKWQGGGVCLVFGVCPKKDEECNGHQYEIKTAIQDACHILASMII